MRSEKLFRVVIRGLHPETTHEEIVGELRNLGHTVVNTTNIISKKPNPNRNDNVKIRVPLPLFFVDIEPSKNNNDIYDVQYISYQKIRVEETRSRSNILVQCKNCQEFDHTKNFCRKLPKCVKCGSNHLTSDCTKSKGTKPKCAGCGEAHTANWRGCSVYKAAYAKKFPKSIKAVERIREQRNEMPPSGSGSYSQVVRKRDLNQNREAPEKGTLGNHTTTSVSNIDLFTKINSLISSFESFRTEVNSRLGKLESSRHTPIGGQRKKLKK